MSQRSANGWDVLFGGSLVAIVIAAWFAFSPTHAAAQAVRSDELPKIESATKDVEKALSDSLASITDRTWDVSGEMFSSRALEMLTDMAAHRGVHLTNFRSGRAIRAATLEEVPCVATLEGSFMDVMALVRDLEAPDTKVAIGQLSISSMTNSDRVSASIAMTGFLVKDSKP